MCRRKTIPAGNSLAFVTVLYNTTRKASNPEILLDMVKFLKDQGLSFTCKVNDPTSQIANTVDDYLFEGFQDSKCSFYEKKLRKSIILLVKFFVGIHACHVLGHIF